MICNGLFCPHEYMTPSKSMVLCRAHIPLVDLGWWTLNGIACVDFYTHVAPSTVDD